MNYDKENAANEGIYFIEVEVYSAMIWDEFLRHFCFCDEEDSGLSDEE